MKRAYLTAKEKDAILIRQDFMCAICGEEMKVVVEYDHSTPVALGNGAKPDQAVHPRCHRIKTARDIKAIAKAKRLAGETGQNRRKRPIPSRPFDKRFRKRMDGTVERRD